MGGLGVEQRGQPLELMDHKGFVTVHPSYLLRVPEQAARRLEYRKFVADLRLIARHAAVKQAA